MLRPQLCQAAGAVLLAVTGTAAPLAFMWHTERVSRRTFAWRLHGKGCRTAASGAEVNCGGSSHFGGSGVALAAKHPKDS